MFSIQHTSRFKLTQIQLLCACLLTFLMIAPAAFGQQKPVQLARIEFEGLKRYGKEQLVEASGLKIGQTVNESGLDEAADKLLQTGFFTNLSYHVHAANNQATVTFVVEEKADKGAPVVFENFVWFSEAELQEAIRREIPSYDGTALETGNMTDSIKSILQRLLKEKNIAGEVEYMPSADASGANPEHIFTVKGIKIPICEVSFTGAAGITESELKANSKSIFNEDYGHHFVVGFANSALRNMYRQRGYLRAKFHEAPVKFPASPACKDGVAVALVAEEGLQYSWEKAVWSENNALSAQELDAAFGMKTGELASSTRIDQGLHEVEGAYGKKGYLEAYMRPKVEYDDANKRVTFSFTAVEGPQYHMGALSFAGIPENLANHLRGKWKLEAGAVYDASYANDFLHGIMTDRELMQAFAGKTLKVGGEPKLDTKKHTVDVIIKFE
jgi:outer membrane protein insertion porin family